MKPIANWANVQAAKERDVLPAGGYVVKIVGAKVAEYPGFERLEIALDISEGDHKGYYEADFKGQTQEDKRWKGVLRQYLPKDDGSEGDEWTKSSLKALIEAIEESNPGYRWDWDEAKLKGKTAGCLFRLEEWAYNGKKGWKAMPFKFIAADKVRQGAFTEPKFKPHKDFPGDTPDNYQATEEAVSGASSSFAGGFQPVPAEDTELLPF